jgi:hypothetical protein
MTAISLGGGEEKYDKKSHPLHDNSSRFLTVI